MDWATIKLKRKSCGTKNGSLGRRDAADGYLAFESKEDDEDKKFRGRLTGEDYKMLFTEKSELGRRR